MCVCLCVRIVCICMYVYYFCNNKLKIIEVPCRMQSNKRQNRSPARPRLKPVKVTEKMSSLKYQSLYA